MPFFFSQIQFLDPFFIPLFSENKKKKIIQNYIPSPLFFPFPFPLSLGLNWEMFSSTVSRPFSIKLLGLRFLSQNQSAVENVKNWLPSVVVLKQCQQH